MPAPIGSASAGRSPESSQSVRQRASDWDPRGAAPRESRRVMAPARPRRARGARGGRAGYGACAPGLGRVAPGRRPPGRLVGLGQDGPCRPAVRADRATGAALPVGQEGALLAHACRFPARRGSGHDVRGGQRRGGDGRYSSLPGPAWASGPLASDGGGWAQRASTVIHEEAYGRLVDFCRPEKMLPGGRPRDDAGAWSAGGSAAGEPAPPPHPRPCLARPTRRGES